MSLDQDEAIRLHKKPLDLQKTRSHTGGQRSGVHSIVLKVIEYTL